MRKTARAFVVVVLVLTSCGEDVKDARLDELAAAEQRLQQAGLSDYTIVVEHGCLCPPEVRGPFEVQVVDGAVAGLEHTDETITEPQPRQLLTVDAIFGYLRVHIGADGFIVTYDTELGYPRSINLDPQENAIDDEFFIRAEIRPD